MVAKNLDVTKKLRGAGEQEKSLNPPRWLVRCHTDRSTVKAKSHLSHSRKSVSGQAADRAQQDRIRRMSVEDRIKEALTIGDRFTWLKPAPKRK